MKLFKKYFLLFAFVALANFTYALNIEGDFEGLEEGNIWELSNGMIVKQVDYTYQYKYEYRPQVVLYKDGTQLMLLIKSMNKAVRVVCVNC